jgi:hypothetical protein
MTCVEVPFLFEEATVDSFNKRNSNFFVYASTMSALISFSLFGTDPKYRLGMLENLRIIKDVMPDWKTIVYCGGEVPDSFIDQLRRCGGQVEIMSPSTRMGGMFWRFLPILTQDFSHVVFRDADSRISLRELALIDQWISTGKTLHIIRDHPHHAFPILGGLWGVTSKVHSYPIPWDLMMDFPGNFGSDQLFLARYVYPVLKNDSFVHDAFFFLERHSVRPLQVHDNSGAFVGESFNGSNQPSLEKRQVVLDIGTSVIRRNLFGFVRTLAMRRYLGNLP